MTITPLAATEATLPITVERGLRVPAADGHTLNTDVYRPAGPAPHPTLLMRLPYGAEIAQSYNYRHPAWYAARGFAVVVQDVRGRWTSTGEFYPYRVEGEDGAAACGWIVDQPWSSGAIGMYGFSYQGVVQLQAVQAGAPGLQAIAPAQMWLDPFSEWKTEGGVPLLGGVLGWGLQLATGDALRTGDEALIAPLRGQSIDALLNAVPCDGAPLRHARYVDDWLSHPLQDEYWRAQRIDAGALSLPPALWVASWYDTFLTGTLNAYGAAAAGSPHQSLVIGPWGHLPWTQQVGQVDFGPRAASPVDRLQLRHFGAVLHGETPPAVGVVAFMSGLNDWRTLPSWPPPVEPRRFYLVSGDGPTSAGLLQTEPPTEHDFDSCVSEPLNPLPALGGHANAGTRPGTGPHDQRPLELRGEVLLYTTPPLEQDTYVVGDVRAVLDVASSNEDCDWIARLCDVAPDGRSLNITQGALRSSARDGMDRQTPLRPHVAEHVTVSLRSCGHLFRAGHRIRLAICGSSFPHYGRNPGVLGAIETLPAAAYRPAVQHVLTGASYLELPLLDAATLTPWSVDSI
jgi:putative CocE/NonD family hydrolase